LAGAAEAASDSESSSRRGPGLRSFRVSKPAGLRLLFRLGVVVVPTRSWQAMTRKASGSVRPGVRANLLNANGPDGLRPRGRRRGKGRRVQFLLCDGHGALASRPDPSCSESVRVGPSRKASVRARDSRLSDPTDPQWRPPVGRFGPSPRDAIRVSDGLRREREPESHGERERERA
jgi:hypothetical protein